MKQAKKKIIKTHCPRCGGKIFCRIATRKENEEAGFRQVGVHSNQYRLDNLVPVKSECTCEDLPGLVLSVIT